MPADAEPTQDRTPTPRPSVVLFRAPGTRTPDELAGALARNNTRAIEVDHALGAMALLCTQKPAVLLLCGGEDLPASRELLMAVERYIPRATRWEYVPGEDPPLRPVAIRVPPSEADPHEGLCAEPSAAVRGDSFAVRLARGSGSLAPESSAAIPGEILTRDEMEALFSED